MNLRNPRMIGFGISNRQTLESSMANASGVIIGSRFVTLLDETHDLEEIACGTGDNVLILPDSGGEYRIYLTEDFRCLRYIGPDGVTVDYPVPEASLDQVTEMYPFCLYAREAVS